MFLIFQLAWWDAAHGMIARIAQREITSKQNQWLTKLFDRWAGDEGDMVSVSGWQDTIKGRGVYAMGDWHFINEPIIDPDSNSSNLNVQYNYNVTSVCADLIETIMDKTTTSDWSLGFAMRSLIHFVGDAHCPMHSVAYYSDSYPSGDYGGNIYYIGGKSIDSETGSLHKIWDNAGMSFKKMYPHDIYEDNITKITKEFTRDILKNDITNINTPLTFAKEAYEIAKNFAYSINVNEVPSEEYLTKVRMYSRRQIALGGYRLSNILNEFFDKRGLVSIPNSGKYKVRANEVVAWCLVVISLLVIVSSYVLNIITKRGGGVKNNPLI